MARRSVETKNVNGILYYTSKYFKNKVFSSDRNARKFLEDFNSLEGHINPKLYDKKTIDKAIYSYMHDPRTKDKYEKKKRSC